MPSTFITRQIGGPKQVGSQALSAVAKLGDTAVPLEQLRQIIFEAVTGLQDQLTIFRRSLGMDNPGATAITDDGTNINIVGRKVTISGALSVGTLTPWANAVEQVHVAADKNYAIGPNTVLADGVSVSSFNDAVNANKGLELRASDLLLGIAGQKVGFYGTAPVVLQVLAAYTPNSQGTAYTGIDNAQAGLVYATVADLNLLRVAYQTLKAAHDDLRTKMQTTTLIA